MNIQEIEYLVLKVKHEFRIYEVQTYSPTLCNADAWHIWRATKAEKPLPAAFRDWDVIGIFFEETKSREAAIEAEKKYDDYLADECNGGIYRPRAYFEEKWAKKEIITK